MEKGVRWSSPCTGHSELLGGSPAGTLQIPLGHELLQGTGAWHQPREPC